MKALKAHDVDGQELQRGDLVEVVSEKDGFPHKWLRVGNTLRVAYWEDRSLGHASPFIVVFLESKKGGRLCQQGMFEGSLRKVVEK